MYSIRRPVRVVMLTYTRVPITIKAIKGKIQWGPDDAEFCCIVVHSADNNQHSTTRGLFSCLCRPASNPGE